MSDTKVDPWALLREAHSFVDPYEGDLFERIHAALAAHDAEERVDSATPVVKWVHREGSRIWSGGLGNAMFDVVLRDDGWKWVVVRERESGVCNTLDEAKAAAIAAARGMQ